MDKSLAKIYEAHVAFMLNRYQKQQLHQAIENLVDSIIVVLADVPVHEWVTAEQVAGYIKRYTVDFPLTGGITEIVGECSKKFLSFEIHKETVLKDFFNRELWNYLVDKIAEMDYLKTRIIQILMRSRLVTHLISDVLYSAVVEYLSQKDTLLSKVSDIMSSMDTETRAKIEMLLENGGLLEEKVHTFVEEHIDMFVESFESRLDRFFTDERLQDYGDEIWNDIFHTPLIEYFELISNEDMEDFIVFGYEFWKQFRKTRFFQKVYEEIVAIIIDRYQSYTVPEMLEDLGFTRNLIIEELYQLVEPFAKKLLDTGRLEKMIRHDLEAFYNSEAARTACASSGK